MKSFKQFIREEFPIEDLTKESGLTSRGEMEKIRGLVIHHSGGRGDHIGLINTAKSRSSQGEPYWAQYGMRRNGTVFEYGPGKAHHVKNSTGRRAPLGLGNHNMHGIEIIANNDDDITPEQHAAIRHFAVRHQKQHGYDSATGFYGHSEMNPGHRNNEGEGIAADLRKNYAAHAKSYEERYLNKSSTQPATQSGSQIARPAGSNAHRLEPQPTKPTEKKPETVTAATPPFVDDKSTKSPEVKQQTTGNVRTPPFVDDKPTEPKLVEPPTVVRTGTTKETQPAPASKPLGSSPGANADRQPETQPAPAQPAAPAATPPTTLKTFRQKAADSTDSDSGGYSGRSSGSDSYSGRSSGSDGSGGDDWRNRAFAGTGSNRG